MIQWLCEVGILITNNSKKHLFQEGLYPLYIEPQKLSLGLNSKLYAVVERLLNEYFFRFSTTLSFMIIAIC